MNFHSLWPLIWLYECKLPRIRSSDPQRHPLSVVRQRHVGLDYDQSATPDQLLSSSYWDNLFTTAWRSRAPSGAPSSWCLCRWNRNKLYRTRCYNSLQTPYLTCFWTTIYYYFQNCNEKFLFDDKTYFYLISVPSIVFPNQRSGEYRPHANRDYLRRHLFQFRSWNSSALGSLHMTEGCEYRLGVELRALQLDGTELRPDPYK